MGKGVGLGRDVRGVGYWFEGFGRGGGIGGRGGSGGESFSGGE
jgi:hypothetical protein